MRFWKIEHPQETNARWVLIAQILRPRGNKGEVLAELHTDFPRRLTSLPEVFLAQALSDVHPIGLQRFWIDQNHPGFGVFHFEGSTSISDAEKFRGLSVLLPLEKRVELPAGTYFVTDLIGCTVFEPADSTPQTASWFSDAAVAFAVLGTVQDVFFPGERIAGTPLLQVQTRNGELLIPLAVDICRSIRVAERRIEVNLPEGLRSINGPE